MSKLAKVGILGATSHVGQALLPLLVKDNYTVFAFSRQNWRSHTDGITWQLAKDLSGASDLDTNIPYWICLSPIAILPDYFDALIAHGVKRIVVLSSTSRFTKGGSSNPADRALAQNFIDSEQRLQAWAENNGIQWVILRPTLIYGLGKDKNVCEIIRLIRKFGFFPLLGEAKGLRQPVHCRDVASACQVALSSSRTSNKSYNLSGGEVLSYRAMVERLFQAIGRKPRFIPVPIALLRFIFLLLRLMPRYRKWSFAMAERMNQDMVFDYAEAGRDLGFKPRGFSLSADDLP